MRYIGGSLFGSGRAVPPTQLVDEFEELDERYRYPIVPHADTGDPRLLRMHLPGVSGQRSRHYLQRMRRHREDGSGLEGMDPESRDFRDAVLVAGFLAREIAVTLENLRANAISPEARAR